MRTQKYYNLTRTMSFLPECVISIGTTRPISRIHRTIAVLQRKRVELNADKSKIEKENHWKTALFVFCVDPRKVSNDKKGDTVIQRRVMLGYITQRKPDLFVFTMY